MSERKELDFVHIDAFDLDDAWFQCLLKILEHGHVYKIDRGSYAGQHRLEFDFVSVHVKNPAHQIIPLMPEGSGIPAPTSMDYIQQYLQYLLTSCKTKTEDYTYGERLVDPKVCVETSQDGNVEGQKMVEEIPLECNQIEEVIKIYKRHDN